MSVLWRECVDAVGVDVYTCVCVVYNCEHLCLDLSIARFYFSVAFLVPPIESLAGAVFAAERLHLARIFAAYV